MTDESPILSIADGGTYIDERGMERPTHRFVSFRFEAVENEAKSRMTGRRVFERALIMRQHYPGARDTLDREILRYPEGSDVPIIQEPDIWPAVRDTAEQWMRNQAEAVSGTPLSLLALNVAELASLKAGGVGSVEMLAALPDAALRAFDGAREMRDKARRYLDAAQDAAPLAKAEAEAVAARDEAAALRQEVAELKALLARRDDADEGAEPRRRGRPPKARDEAA
ncbi:MAG TPA: hypothetical protein VGN96_11185 [Roseococcus sp.]|jgi:hypothetical protein|nr:hypothetical protein [Roseococcus sp.]